MKPKILISKKVKEKLDIRAVLKIVIVLKNRIREKGVDSLQIFEVKDDKLINRQRTPKYEKEYELGFSTKQNERVYAVEVLDIEVGRYWDIIFPNEF